MKVEQLNQALEHAIEKRSLIMISGPHYSGKTWILETQVKNSELITMKKKNMMGESTRLSLEELINLQVSELPTVSIDEASIMDSGQVLGVTEYCLSKNRAVIIACSEYKCDLDVKLYKIAKLKGRSVLVIELKDWNSKENKLGDFSLSYPD